MKLREISRLVEVPESPLSNSFQRRSPQREKTPQTRVHESTVMRWLEKTYEKVLRAFKNELAQGSNLKETEINLCMDIAAQSFENENVGLHLTPISV